MHIEENKSEAYQCQYFLYVTKMSKNFQENWLQYNQLVFTNLLVPHTFQYSIQYYI